MPEPVTIGALIAAALATVADATLKGVVTEAVKDTYRKLKEKLWPTASTEIKALEAKPNSQGKQLAIAEIVNEQSEAEHEALRTLALKLLADVKESAPVGLDLEQLSDVEINLRNINVSRGVGIRLRDAHGGTINIDSLNVGGSGGN